MMGGNFGLQRVCSLPLPRGFYGPNQRQQKDEYLFAAIVSSIFVSDLIAAVKAVHK
jgi:hypothetical protein